MEQYEEACNYILKTAMIQKEVIRFVMDSIEVPELAALLIGKISRGSELGIRVQLDPGTHLDKEGNMSYGQALVTIVGLFGSLLLIKPLNALLLGERYAENLGVNIRRVRNWLLIITGLLTLSPPLSVVRSPLSAWPCRMWPA